MSNFNTFAARVDEIAKAAFKEYTDAEAELKRAEANRQPRSTGMVDAEQAARAARAEADYLEAKEKVQRATRNLTARVDSIAAIRQELAAELDTAYSVNPEQIDTNTMTLLQAGIMRPSEYIKMMDAAEEAGNVTMMRLIAKYAGEAAADAAKQYGESSNQAMTLRSVLYRGNSAAGSDTLSKFDILADTFRRTANNPYMIGHWDELTADLISNF